MALELHRRRGASVLRRSGLVVGTGNKTETLIGYTTLWGDSASAFNPIGDLYKSQVRQLSEAMGVPDAILRKAPSADLWPGQTDESEVGFSYAEVDRIPYWLVDRRRSVDELERIGFPRATVERVVRMVASSQFRCSTMVTSSSMQMLRQVMGCIRHGLTRCRARHRRSTKKVPRLITRPALRIGRITDCCLKSWATRH